MQKPSPEEIKKSFIDTLFTLLLMWFFIFAMMKWHEHRLAEKAHVQMLEAVQNSEQMHYYEQKEYDDELNKQRR